MRYLLIFAIIFSVTSMQANETQQITNMHQIFNTIGRTTDDILSFAKSTIEEYPSPQQTNSELFLNLPDEAIESDNTLEKIGAYLNATSDEELRSRIEKDPIAEGSVLLNDFFKSAMHKELRKKIDAFVTGITSCAFLAPEERKIFRELTIFYPENYDGSAYSWEPTFKDGKLDALVGRLHNIVGLKGSMQSKGLMDGSLDAHVKLLRDIANLEKNLNALVIKIDDFIAVIDVIYTCQLRYAEKRIAPFKGATLKHVGPSINVYIEPQHNMTVSITFLRQKFSEGSAVSHICHVFGGERIFSAVENIPNLLKDHWLGHNWKSATIPSATTPNDGKYWAPMTMELDLQETAYGPVIREEFVITSAGNFTDCRNFIDTDITDFIIQPTA